MPLQRLILILAVCLALGGCAVVTVAGAAVGAAITVTGAVVGAGVSVAGKVVEKSIDAVSDDEDKKKDD